MFVHLTEFLFLKLKEQIPIVHLFIAHKDKTHSLAKKKPATMYQDCAMVLLMTENDLFFMALSSHCHLQ